MADKDLPVTISGLTRKQFMKKYGFDPLKISSGIQGGQTMKQMFKTP